MKRPLSSASLSIILVLAAVPSTAAAANRFSVENKELWVGGTGQTISFLCENDFPAYAFTLTAKYEPAKIAVTAIDLAGATEGAEWSDLKFDNATGDIIAGVVLDLSPSGASDKVIPAGTAKAIVQITVDTIVTGSSTTLIDLRDRAPRADGVEIKNLLTNGSAVSVLPTLEDRTVNIRDPKPAISALQYNTGEPGKDFVLIVDNLLIPGAGQIGLTVCGKALVQDAEDGFWLHTDGRTVFIIAPDCGTSGWAPVTVSTAYGSDTEAQGFDYTLKPVIEGISGNVGSAGKVFQVTGGHLDNGALTVKVGGTEAPATLRADKITLDVTAPEGGPGWAALQVCNADGCASAAQGFDYSSAVLFIRGDANKDGEVDLADAISVFGDLFLGSTAAASCRDALDTDDSGTLDITDGIAILGYLFQGSRPPKDPYPDPGTDPTADDLPSC